MKKTVLTFGLISGAISAAMMLITIPFVDKIGFPKRGNPRRHHDRALGTAGVLRGAFVSRECHGRTPHLRARLRRRHPHYINL
jgi:hypothetical protein